MTEEKPRTLSQNASLHLFCQQVALAARENGLTMQKMLEGAIELEPTQEGIKSLFRQIAKAMYGCDSTKDLTTREMTETYEVFNRFLAEKPRCLHVPWPSEESLSLKNL